MREEGRTSVRGFGVISGGSENERIARRERG
jgi:hypothetical protein